MTKKMAFTSPPSASNDFTGEFLSALKAGKLCLHPSDTIPGLGCNPFDEGAVAHLYALKLRDARKPCIGLVANLATAQLFFAPLSAKWQRVLAKVWPAPLTVVYKASAQAPALLCSEQHHIALRVPRLRADSVWLQQVLETVGYPLPTTSVNVSETEAARTWEDALEFCQGKEGLHIPNAYSPSTYPTFSTLPSTVIAITGEQDFTCLRRGEFPLPLLERLLEQNHE